MATLVNWQNDVRNNPLHHLEVKLLNRRRGKWFWWGVIALTFLVFAIPLIWRQAPDFYDALNITLVLLTMLNLAAMLMLIFRASTFGTMILSRELNAQTWEMLILTGVDSRRLIIGKWLGVMRYLLRDAGWVIAIRMSMLFWFIVSSETFGDVSYLGMEKVSLGDATFTSWWIPQMLALTAVFVLLELALSSALGLLTAMRHQRISSGLSLLIRFGVPGIIVFGALMVFSLSNHNCLLSTENDYQYCNDSLEPTLMAVAVPGFATLTLLDNANFSSFVLLSLNESPLSSEELAFVYRTFLGGYLLAGIFYVVGTAAAIWVTVWRVQRLGANKIGFIYKQKAKRTYELPEEPQSVTTVFPDKPRKVDIEPISGQANLLKLTDPDTYTVELFSYQKAFKRAILKVFGQGEDFFLEFHNVAFLHAPVVTVGANLRAADSDTPETLFRFNIGDEITIAADTVCRRSGIT